MNALSRYILRQLLFSTLIVTGVLSLLVVLFQSLRLIDMVVNRGASIGTFAELTISMAPPVVAQLLSVGTLASVLYTYTRLMADRELVAMRATGTSQFGLAKPVLALAAIAAIVGYSITLYFGPLSQQNFRSLRYAASNSFASIFLREGRFNTPIDGVTVYIRSRTADGELRGIILHDARVRQRPVTWMAERGAIVVSDGGPQVVMFNGNRQEVSGPSGQLALIYFERGAFDLDALDPTLASRTAAGGERFLHQRFNPEPEAQPRRNALFVEGLKRLAMPLAPFAYGLVALAALLTGDFNRRGQSLRVTAAIAAAIALQFIDAGAAALATETPALRPLMFAGPAVFGGVSAWILLGLPARRVRRPRPALTPAGA